MFENQYLTYVEYGELGGLLDENAFNLLEYEAQKQIDKATMGRLVDLETQVDDVKLCIYKLIGIMNANNTDLKGESVDGYSYTNYTKEELETIENDTIEDYLSECKLDDEYNTPYLYRGADRECYRW